MIRAFFLCVALACASCILVERPDGLRVASLGKGCIYADGESTIAESDGVSVNLASLFRGLGEIVGAVFGGAREASPGLEQGEGCRGVLDQVYEQPDPTAAARAAEDAAARARAIDTLRDALRTD